MAQKKSQAKDETMTTRQAGKLGGDKVKAERGPEFYSEIGRMQGAEVNPGNFKNRKREEVVEAAERGGRTRGQQIHEAVQRAHELEDQERAA
jgi:general stress protein YciG